MTRALLLLCLSVAVVACDDDPSDVTDSTDTTDSTDSTDDTDTAEGDIAAGATVFSNNCVGCHGAEGTGTGSGPNLNDRVPGMSIGQVQQTALQGTGNMPSILSNETDALDVAAFVVDKHGS